MGLVKRMRWWIVAALVVIVGGLFALAMMQTVRADHSAVRGKAALARAQSDIDAQNVHAARADLLVALGEFKQMHHNLTTPHARPRHREVSRSSGEDGRKADSRHIR